MTIEQKSIPGTPEYAANEAAGKEVVSVKMTRGDFRELLLASGMGFSRRGEYARCDYVRNLAEKLPVANNWGDQEVNLPPSSTEHQDE